MIVLLLFQRPSAIGAYQLAVLSLLVTMLIGAWLIWPVSDRWAGSGEVVHHVRTARATGPGRRADRAALGRSRQSA